MGKRVILESNIYGNKGSEGGSYCLMPKQWESGWVWEVGSTQLCLDEGEYEGNGYGGDLGERVVVLGCREPEPCFPEVQKESEGERKQA